MKATQLAHGTDCYAGGSAPPAGAPLCDAQILARAALPDGDPMRLRITPMSARPEQEKRLPDGRPCVSYGLSSFGYDIRLGGTFRHMRVEDGAADPVCISPFTDPERVWHPPMTRTEGSAVVIPPHGCLLAESWERVRVPEDCSVLVLCKSTWARVFLNLNTTPLEPGWEGTVTLELHNQSPRFMEVFVGHGIGQLQFFRGEPPRFPYNRRPGGGTYQDQSGPTPARLTRLG